MNTRPRFNPRTRAIHLLLVLALVGAGALTVGFSPPYQPDRVDLGPNIRVTTTDDVVADDGACSLREAVIAANTNTASGTTAGECRAGRDDKTDRIQLAKGANYSLTIDSTPNEDAALDGDLDIWDNSAAVDLFITAKKAGAATISQDAAVDDRVFHILGAMVLMKGLTITGGFHPDVGGGIAIDGGGLKAIRSQIMGNSTNGGGGGISNAGLLRLKFSSVSGNSSDTGGGVLNSGEFKLVHSSITGNSAIAGGGGVWNGGVISIIHSQIDGNQASGGGGLFNDGGSAFIIQHSQVNGNTASNVGGGVVNTLNNSTLTVIGSSLSGNSAVGPSGGESCGGLENQEGATANLVRTTIADNQASWNGAGLCNGGSLTVKNSWILRNSGTGDGGGVHNSGAGVLDMYDSRVSGNHGGWGGGLLNGSVLNLYSTKVTKNTADDQGGGLMNWPGGILNLTGSVISGNSASSAGGLINLNGGVTIVKKSAISRNTVTSFGGGIINAGEMTLQTIRLVANVAEAEGGGALNSGALVITDSFLSANFAGAAGGGVFNWGALVIRESLLFSNTSPGEGDAVYNDLNIFNATNITGSCIVGNGDTAVFNPQPALSNAPGNWWGDPSGPSGVGPGTGDSVSENVDFSSWLTTPPDKCDSD